MHDKKIIPSPLYRDPVYDGATDPVVIYNREEKTFWMLYTQRRASSISIGVSNIHGTKIGVASSTDGYNWLYRGTLSGLEFEPGENTFWAPEVIYAQGKYHMYVSYVKGIPTNWNWERHIVHYTADSMWDWNFESVLPLSSNRVIDACVYETEPGLYKMWYKDECHDSHTYSAVSRDLYQWEVLGAEITDVPHEGANVFELQGKKWMITDFWKGLAVYESEDYTNWQRNHVILNEAGTRTDDNDLGHHADIVVCDDNAYIFYFVHPGLKAAERIKDELSANYQRSRASVFVARLYVKDNLLCCDRDEEFELKLNREV
ncbi:glycosyl hydrolase [Anaerocolumna cellulosilytica]|uniref:Glycosyl hydrolase n=1 Tax=Anaerocolumna cellulosilytica TaxID=433286 RepID=A0A6S6R3K5_9FIRM|nr:glycosyl hydrolase [Anaerocolumna cellulosilytica]MBB5195407.1 hypothetical protein [Anaerocolumna cellulosilytica]BCJ95939.1 glycosyl hydrolase [Anaerocolumna cellulosilytica]